VAVLLGVIATVILKAQGLGVATLRDPITRTEDLSKVLFSDLLLPFEVTSVLILIAILGAVALARAGSGHPVNKDPFVGTPGGERRVSK
jgi:NADH-quinone oxidoreductase subunit J